MELHLLSSDPTPEGLTYLRLKQCIIISSQLTDQRVLAGTTGLNTVDLSIRLSTTTSGVKPRAAVCKQTSRSSAATGF